MSVHLRRAISLLIWFQPLTGPATAQESIEEALKDPYVAAFRDILIDWSNNKIVIEKPDVQSRFYAAIDRRAADPVYEFETADNYVSNMRARWSELPPTLKKEGDFSAGAQMVMLGSIYDRREAIADRVGAPDELLDEIRMSVFVVFSESQVEADAFNLDFIDSRSVLSAYDEFWSIPWPLCCWRSPR